MYTSRQEIRFGAKPSPWSLLQKFLPCDPSVTLATRRPGAFDPVWLSFVKTTEIRETFLVYHQLPRIRSFTERVPWHITSDDRRMPLVLKAVFWDNLGWQLRSAYIATWKSKEGYFVPRPPHRLNEMRKR